jgi:hypothetical protein
MMRRFAGWWFEPVPRARIALMRTLCYLFIPVDVFVTASWVTAHANLPPERYHALLLGRLLHLPVPTHDFVYGLRVALVLAAVAAATGRLPRLLGAVVFGLYFEWMFVAMSYGKVDHDRFAFLVALAVLPTVGAAHFRDRTRCESSGWALRAVQVSVVLTYFLAVFAKWRYGTLNWPNNAAFTYAILRRGTSIGDLFLTHPYLIRAMQWSVVVMELSMPLVLFLRRPRDRYIAAGALYAFHVVTYSLVTIIFLPHCVAIAAFLPLERLVPRRRPAAGLLPVAVEVPEPRVAGELPVALNP